MGMNINKHGEWEQVFEAADLTDAVHKYELTDDGSLIIEWVTGDVATFVDHKAAMSAVQRAADDWETKQEKQRDHARLCGEIVRARRKAVEWLRPLRIETSRWGSAYITLRSGRLVRLSDHAPTSSNRFDHDVSVHVGSAELDSRAALRAEVARQLRESRL